MYAFQHKLTSLPSLSTGVLRGEMETEVEANVEKISNGSKR